MSMRPLLTVLTGSISMRRRIVAGCLVIVFSAPGGAAAQGLLDRLLNQSDTGPQSAPAQTNTPALAAAIAAIAAKLDSVWRGRWEGTCRLPGDHDMTIAIAGNQLVGEVVTNYGRTGMFTAEVRANNRFAGSLSGLANQPIPVSGRFTKGRIKGSWTFPNDCGEGKFTLAPAEIQPRAGPTPEQQTDDEAVSLESLRDQGLITQAEYEAKLAALGGAAASAVRTRAAYERISQLEALYRSGLITQAEYEQFRKELGSGP